MILIKNEFLRITLMQILLISMALMKILLIWHSRVFIFLAKIILNSQFLKTQAPSLQGFKDV